MENAVNYLITVFDKLFTMADKVYTHFGVYPFIFGLFFVFTVGKFLLLPLFGGFISTGSSDIAAKVNEDRRSKAREWNEKVRRERGNR